VLFGTLLSIALVDALDYGRILTMNEVDRMRIEATRKTRPSRKPPYQQNSKRKPYICMTLSQPKGTGHQPPVSTYINPHLCKSPFIRRLKAVVHPVPVELVPSGLPVKLDLLKGQVHRVHLPSQSNAASFPPGLFPAMESVSTFFTTPSGPRSLVYDRTPRRHHKVYSNIVDELLKRDLVVLKRTANFVNPFFLVTRPDKTFRFITNCELLSQHVAMDASFTLPRPRDFLRAFGLLKGRILVAKRDLSSFFWTIRIPECIQPFLSLPSVRRSGVRFYPWLTRLPQGLNVSPIIAQRLHMFIVDKALKSLPPHVAASIRVFPNEDPMSQGIVCCIIVYIDDLVALVQEGDRHVVDAFMKAYEEAAESFGFAIKKSKTVHPTADDVTALGVTINGGTRSIGPDAGKLSRLVQQTHDLLRCDVARVGKRRMQSLVGSWAYLTSLTPHLFMLYDKVYQWLSLPGDTLPWNGPRAIPVKEELWSAIASIPFLQHLSVPVYDNSHVLLATDASSCGVGAVVADSFPMDRYDIDNWWWYATDDGWSSFPWEEMKWKELLSAPLVSSLDPFMDARVTSRTILNAVLHASPSSLNFSSLHITEKELLGALLGLLLVEDALPDNMMQLCPVTLLMDASSVQHALNKGRSSSARFIPLLRRITSLLLRSSLLLRTVRVDTTVQPADEPSRRFQ
jgi:Reverse transcriptase (RNA-dependent DNA polymerase)